MKESARYKTWINAVLKANFGRCPHCGKKPNGGNHHIIGRSCKKTKFVVENGISTCFEFHRMWETPRLHEKLVKKYVGIEKYNKLRKLANGYITLEESGFKEVK